MLHRREDEPNFAASDSKSVPNPHFVPDDKMSSTPVKPSPFAQFDSPSGRQSPFRRQQSASPAPTRSSAPVMTPTSSPTKGQSGFSPSKAGSLSPEKASPFVRRPSQINNSAARPSSPLARPPSSTSISTSASRPPSATTRVDDSFANRPLASPFRSSVHNLKPTSISILEDDGNGKSEDYDDDITPTVEAPPPSFSLDGTHSTRRSEEPSSFKPPSQANLRPVTSRPLPSAAPLNLPQPPKPYSLPTSTKPTPTKTTYPSIPLNGNPAAPASYTNLPPALVHSMRESFEVLDSRNSGSIGPPALTEMLSQLGLDDSPAALATFFPPSNANPLNLARYLDILSTPLSQLSAPAELRAAFEAFDLDDSGQIDTALLRDALLSTSPHPGDGEDQIGAALSAREVDAVISQFAGRRAFGSSKGMAHASFPSTTGNPAQRGEVFRYRDFMTSVSGGAAGGSAEGVAGV